MTKWAPSYTGSNIAVPDWVPEPVALKPYTDADCPWYRASRVLGDNLYLDESGEPTISVIAYAAWDDVLDSDVSRGYFTVAHFHWNTLKVTWTESMEDEHGLSSPCEVTTEDLCPVLLKQTGVPEPMFIFWHTKSAKVFYVPVNSVTRMEMGGKA